ncbi:hypothetical protein [Methylomonas rosea]|uniref:Secreted protein with PEP-CTERM sorting signal n=1 Tax=Methylomonas rosea TaxID=2952227 RepID=A0ABT1TR73_9GAMM|nr:hypothetical protein [Methylomonas sp. WSC-7]MCQ8117261.1 hypothetical protein [Methylomonas sp. WSC-7]
MILKTKLSHAISLALAGTTMMLTLSDASASAVVSYNAFNHDRNAPNDLVSGGTGTDGWMRTTTNGVATCGAVAGGTCGAAPGSFGGPGNNATAVLAGGNGAVPWVGGDPRSANAVGTGQFGYIGMQTLNWTAEIGAGNTAVVSKLDSHSRYQNTTLSDGSIFNYADIDTAKGAWHDGGLAGTPAGTPVDPLGSGTGWRHDTDIGLFRSSVTQVVTLSISSLLGNGDTNQTPDYGFTVFKGMDTKTPTSTSQRYSHHSGWHAVSNADALAVGDNVNPITGSNPFGTTGLTLANLILDDTSGNNATFLAEAGQVYTIYLGGFMGGDWTETRNDYQLTISSVPVPGAVWLFGSAFVGMIGVQRRKRSSR